jgi:hypothetical protein
MCKRYDFSWLSLALEIRILTDTLIKRVEDTEPGQLELFPIDIKTRQRFMDLARTFDACLKSPELDTESPHHLDFYRYEMFGFVQRIEDEQWTPVIESMLAISNGVPLEKENYLTLIEFFDGLERRAIHLTRHGG